MVKKKVILDSRGHYRYYSARYNPKRGKLKGFERPKCPIIDLEKHLNVTTEKHFVRGIFKAYGAGEYLIFAFIKGKKGTWVFGKWILNAEGFLREKRITNYTKAKNKIKEQLVTADEDEREDLIDDLEFEKEYKLESLYGMNGHLKLSSKVGIFTNWKDETFKLKKEKFDEWDSGKDTKASKDEWGTNVSRTKVNKKKFAEW